MADDSEDPDIKAGREIAAGKKPASSPTIEDPDVVAGRAIATAPSMVTQTGPAVDEYGRPMPGIDQSWPAMTWRGTAREVAGALPRIAGNVGNVLSDVYANIGGRALLTAGATAYDFLAPMLGGERMSPETRNALYEDFGAQPGTQAIKTIGQTVGADPYNIQGTTPAEKFIGNVVEGAGTAAAFAPSVAAPIVGGAATAGGQIAAANVPDWLQPGAELAGNIVGAKLGSAGANIGTKAIGAVTGATTPVGAAFDRLGIDRTLVGDVSDSNALKTLQAYTSQAPGSAGTVLPKERTQVGQFGNAVEDTAGRLGQSKTEQAAGDILQSEARNWKDVVFPQREAQAWQPVDQLLGGAAVDPSNYRAALTSLTNKLAALPQSAKALVPPKTQALLDAINQDVPAGQTMTWQQAQNLRSALGQVMGVPEIVQSVGKDQLKAAYGGISEDMRATATAVDAARPPGANTPSAVDAFNNANKVSTDGHAFIDNTLSKIVKSNNPTQETVKPEDATGAALRGGDTTLQAIRQEMPRAADELAAYKLRDMVMATAGKAGVTGSESSVATFLTDLNRIRQEAPNGFRALYSDPTVAQRIGDLATVADQIKDTASRLNVSRTGPFNLLAGSIAGGGGMFAGGVPPQYALPAIMAPFVANYLAGRAATSPTLARIASAPGPRNLPNPLLTGLLVDNEEQRRRNALTRP
jgi:hypothetical protein